MFALDREQLAVEVDAFSPQLEKLSTPKPRVHGEQYRRCQVNSKVRKGREQLFLASLPPGVRGLAALAHLGVPRAQGVPQARFLRII